METKRRWIKIGAGSSLTDRILNQAGISDKDYFLNGKLADLHPIELLNDGILAGKIIKDAISNDEQIIVYSDYDSDGAAGAAVAVLMLRELGARVDYYTNDRFTQGYGMCVSGVDEIIEKFSDVKLIITVDNGVSAFAGADYAVKKGLKLVITDHHEPGETLPVAHAIVNPKRKDSMYPFTGPCGATVVWKVIRELYEDKKVPYKYLDILAIATVGDVVPLIDENRILVKEGLKLLRKETRISLKILKEETGTTNINAINTLGFLYAPIFNAVGRLDGDIDSVIDMYISEDETFVRETVQRLVTLNDERKALTNIQLEQAMMEITKNPIPEVIMYFKEDFHEGIVGLIAGRIKEKFNRPTIIMTRAENGYIKGSGRSIEGFNLKENLDECKDLMVGYGGHEMAAGLTMDEKDFEALREKLISIAKSKLTEDDFVKKFYYIEDYKESDITQDLVEELSSLEPFGASFPKPLIRLKKFNVKRVFTMGKEKEHLKLVGENLTVIAWRHAETYKQRGNPLGVNALGYPELNIYNNNVSVQFMVNEDNFY